MRFFGALVIIICLLLALGAVDFSNKASRSLRQMFGTKKVKAALETKIQDVLQRISSSNYSKPIAKADAFEELILEPLEPNVGATIQENRHLIPVFFEKSKFVISSLGKCLRAGDRCNQKADGSRFDPDKTPEHRKLNRSLMAIQEIIGQDLSYYNELNREELVGLTSINNDNTPILAAQILLQGQVSETEFLQLLVNSKNLRGRVRAVYLSVLSELQADIKKDYVRAVYSALADKSDRYTALEVQKNLGQYKLAQSEFETAIKKSCYLRNDGTGEDMWPILRRNFATQSEYLGYTINPDDFCKSN